MRLLPKSTGELAWTPYAWLIYLSFQYIQPVLTGRPFDWWLVLGSTAVFLPLYFRGFWVEGTHLLPLIAAITLIGAVTAPFNASSSCYFVYAAAFAGGVGPPRTALRVIVAIVVFVLLLALWPGIPFFGWISGSVFALIIGGINVHQAEQRRANERLRLAQEEVERMATLAERERIARDLHDLLGHTLSTITLKADLAQRLVVTEPERAQAEMSDVETISREALSEVRRAVENYRQARIGPELSKAKVSLAAAAVALEIESSPYELASETESEVALALREAVTNVIRHARASHCRIHLAQNAGCFHLTVADDGRGGNHSEGSGLKGMRERIEALGGTLSWKADRGTEIVIEVPTRVGSSLSNSRERKAIG